MAPRQVLTAHHKMFFLQVFQSRGAANLRDVADRLKIPKSTLASIINDKKRVVTVCRTSSIGSIHEPESRLSCGSPRILESPRPSNVFEKQRWASLGSVATPSRCRRSQNGADDSHVTELPPSRLELLRSLSTLRIVIECLEDAPLWYTFALDDLFLSCLPVVSRWRNLCKRNPSEKRGRGAKGPPERKEVLDAVWTIQRAFRSAQHPVWFSFAVSRLFQSYIWR